jgi:hypothetical protein
LNKIVFPVNRFENKSYTPAQRLRPNTSESEALRCQTNLVGTYLIGDLELVGSEN